MKKRHKSYRVELSKAFRPTAVSFVQLETAITKAVRSKPECQFFAGVILERLENAPLDGRNWAIKGIKYGRAPRGRCDDVIKQVLADVQASLIADEFKKDEFRYA